MKDKILLECLECNDCFIGDKNSDGYKCPRCGGMIIPRGYIEKHKEYINETEKKIKSAIWNGNIRDTTHREKLNKKYMYGVDLSDKKDSTVITVQVNIDELTQIDDVIKMFNDLKKSKRVVAIG